MVAIAARVHQDTARHPDYPVLVASLTAPTPITDTAANEAAITRPTIAWVTDTDGRVLAAAAKGQPAPAPPWASRFTRALPGARPAPHGELLSDNGHIWLVAGTPLPHGWLVAARPVDNSLVIALGARFSLPDFKIDKFPDSAASVPLNDARGQTIGALSWDPRAAGRAVLAQMALPLLLLLMVLGYSAILVLRRTSAMASDLITSEAQARHLAYHDTLTQLPNRALMYYRLKSLLMLSRRYYSEIAVHCLDLDRFKEVNDTLGHPAGDELIQQVAQRLLEICRESDTVARLGGDEFIVLQPEASGSGASHLAERILKSFEEPFELSFGTVEVGCSIGVTVITDPEMEPTEALRQADLALYGSKERGRNRVTFFEPDMDAALRMRRALETDLRHALANGALTMVYQPQVDENGDVASLEALVRWDHPEKGPIPPSIFVPLAEESGLILDLGEFIFDRVLAETANWGATRVAINVSTLQLKSPMFMSTVTRAVATHHADPMRYEIEVTEAALQGYDGITRDNLLMLKQEGFTIALDDFGTGYSTLNSLKRFMIDRIKIDRSFVHNLGAGAEAEALVEAIVKLSRAMQLGVVAEGVETEAQRTRLAARGCDFFQGYLLSHPLPADAIVPLLINVGH